MSEYLRLDPKPGDLAMVRRIKAERVKYKSEHL